MDEFNFLEVPFPDSYWVVPGLFLAGEYPGSRSESDARKRIQELLKTGLRAFFDLTRPGELEPYEAMLQEEADWLGLVVEYHQISIQEFGVANTPEITHTLDAIEAAMTRDMPVYLHCHAGIGRTGLLVGCYLARHGFTGQVALEHLTQLRRSVPGSEWTRSPESDEQVEVVLYWKQDQ